MDHYVRIEKHGSRRFSGGNGAVPKAEANTPSSKYQREDTRHKVSGPAEAEMIDVSDYSGLSSEQIEDELRLFDLDPRYGPFVGIDRLTRWNRAKKFGLEPPMHVKSLLECDGAVAQRSGGHLW